ncbi:PKDREJ [Branchiostoma lanceolatum]|uniref:PKDREJ protein n=1 Tax=Branchiostoma lanceolatum TaxID=7740 RepID=A0A8J9W3S5_BRALA|nr:PKDREJ [Branchiostoma lanceolatum]
MRFNGNITIATAQTWIEFFRRSVVATVGSSLRTVPATGAILVDAGMSYDPEGVLDSAAFTYDWACRVLDLHCCHVVGQQKNGTNPGQLLYEPTTDFPVRTLGAVVNISVQVRPGNSTTYQGVYAVVHVVTTESSPGLTLECETNCDPGNTLQVEPLELHTESDILGTTEFALTEYPAGFLLQDWTLSKNASDIRLKVPSDVFKVEGFYTIRLTDVFGDLTRISEWRFHVYNNPEPTSAENGDFSTVCALLPADGVSLLDTFCVQCEEFTDPLGPIQTEVTLELVPNVNDMATVKFPGDIPATDRRIVRPPLRFWIMGMMLEKLSMVPIENRYGIRGVALSVVMLTDVPELVSGKSQNQEATTVGFECLDIMDDTYLNHLFPEYPNRQLFADISMPQIHVRIQREEQTDVSEKVYHVGGDSDSLVRVPSYSALPNGDCPVEKNAGVQYLESNFNPYEYSNNSQVVRSEVIGLHVKCGNITLPVSGLSDPIDILIRRKNESFEESIYAFQSSSLLGNLTVKIALNSLYEESSPFTLHDRTRFLFEKGSVDSFLVSTAQPLGGLTHLRVWHDSSGHSPGWFLRQIVVTNRGTGETSFFLCNRWLAADEDDGKVHRILIQAEPDEMTKFQNLFFAKSARDMNDDHVWFSVLGRPARSPFTRVQRLSCCLTLMYCTMLANIMFFGRGDDFDPPAPIRFAGMVIKPPISLPELMISIQSAAIILPVNLIIVFLFRHAKSATKPNGEKEQKVKTTTVNRTKQMPSLTYHSDDPDTPTSWSYVIGVWRYPGFTGGSSGHPQPQASRVESNNSTNEPENSKKAKFSLPLWTTYIAWFLIWAASFVASYFTVLYTLSFGRAKAEAWLVTFLTTFFTDLFLMQPFKLLAVAVLFALIAKEPIEDEDPPPSSLQEDEEYLQTNADNLKRPETATGWTNYFRKEKARDSNASNKKDHEPARLHNILAKQREARKRRSMVLEVLFFGLFLTVLLVMSYVERSTMAYHMTQNIQNTIIGGGEVSFSEVKDISSFWTWMNLSFIPVMYGASMNNVKDNQEDALQFSYLVGPVQLRNIRIKPDLNCQIPVQMMAVESHCNLPYSEGVADTHNYIQGWIPDNSTDNTTDDVCTENPVPSDATRSPTYSHCDDGQEMWKYTFVSFANGFPYVGQHGIYRGGGYVASLGTTNQSSSNITAYLQQHSWLDNQTRAVFIEVTLYNPHVDLFSVFSIAVEFTNTGGVYRSSEAVTLRLRQHDAVLLLVLRGFLALFLVYFAFTEAKKLFVRPLDYVIEVWNWMELFIVTTENDVQFQYIYA